MPRTRNLNHPHSRDTYATDLVRHFTLGKPKPRLRAYRDIKEFPEDCVLDNEQLFDLSALLGLLQEIDNECQGPLERDLDAFIFYREDIEEALTCFLGRFCRDGDESPVFLPEYNRDIKEFNDDLNNYLLALRLSLHMYVPKLFQRFHCLVLGFTIKLARARVLTGFDKLCRQGVHWTYRRD